jgi:hypothetical protein
MHEKSVPAPDITENVSCRKTKNILLFMKKNNVSCYALPQIQSYILWKEFRVLKEAENLNIFRLFLNIKAYNTFECSFSVLKIKQD